MTDAPQNPGAFRVLPLGYHRQEEAGDWSIVLNDRAYGEPRAYRLPEQFRAMLTAVDLAEPVDNIPLGLRRLLQQFERDNLVALIPVGEDIRQLTQIPVPRQNIRMGGEKGADLHILLEDDSQLPIDAYTAGFITQVDGERNLGAIARQLAAESQATAANAFGIIQAEPFWATLAQLQRAGVLSLEPREPFLD